uniref:Alternative protein COPZ1 n=1 Tax=Homo sapiens TaxID=9606 RepID=L0R4W7_HUMAN|nr:alternative protein COPZ1 [Homo sapiens]
MMEIDFLPSTMTTPTPVSRSKRPLRRTFSTRPIGLTVKLPSWKA